MLIPIVLFILGIIFVIIGWDLIVSPGEKTMIQGLIVGAIGFFAILSAILLIIIGTAK